MNFVFRKNVLFSIGTLVIVKKNLTPFYMYCILNGTIVKN